MFSFTKHPAGRGVKFYYPALDSLKLYEKLGLPLFSLIRNIKDRYTGLTKEEKASLAEAYESLNTVDKKAFYDDVISGEWHDRLNTAFARLSSAFPVDKAEDLKQQFLNRFHLHVEACVVKLRVPESIRVGIQDYFPQDVRAARGLTHHFCKSIEDRIEFLITHPGDAYDLEAVPAFNWDSTLALVKASPLVPFPDSWRLPAVATAPASAATAPQSLFRQQEKVAALALVKRSGKRKAEELKKEDAAAAPQFPSPLAKKKKISSTT